MERLFLHKAVFRHQKCLRGMFEIQRCINLSSNVTKDEDLPTRKARLLYQSRKRGMLENGLLLSTFAAKYLASLTPELTEQYDELINSPSNDWDLYYWLIGKESVPEEFDNEIMSMLKKYVTNEYREQRLVQPDLNTR